LTGRFLGTRDQATGRDNVLSPGETVDVVHGIEPHQGYHRAHAWHRAPAVEGLGVVVRGVLAEGACQIGEPLVVVGDQRPVDGEAFVHGRVGNAFSDAMTIGLVGDVLPDRRPVILAVGLLDMRQACSACAHQRRAAPEQVPGRPPRSWIDRRLGPHAAAQPCGNLVGIDRVVFGLAPMEGFHVEGMPQPAGNPRLSPEISPPRPGEEAFDGHHEAVTRGCHSLEKRVRSRCHVAVHEDFPVTVHETDGQAPGLEVDPAVKLVWVGVATHEVSSACVSGFSHCQQTTGVC
jgi:hypothetical protein